MPRNIKNQAGFGLIEGLISIIVIVVIVIGGIAVYRHYHKTKTTNSVSTTSRTTTSKNSVPTTTKPADPYAGWKTYCDSANLHGCFKYPSDWVASQYGGFENAGVTAYVDYSGYNNKDQASNSAYIAQIANVSDTTLNLKIVGSIYNNVPSYAIFNASDVTTLTVGETAQLITANPEFQKNPGQDQSFIATPGANGLKAITSLDQAKAWFNTSEAQDCLKVLESFYYQ